jgi:hypothetical protein
MKIIHLILISLFLNLTLATQSQANESPMWPNSHYQKNIPTYSEVLGYEVGERISSHTDMLRFFDALALASPKNIKIFEYGRTWENRKLIYAVIGSAENIANLNQFEADMQHLSDPRTIDKAQANNLINKTPASVWLSYSVHGNEISSTDAAMMTAYHLLASVDDTMVNKILDNTLVFIDPLQNPDGRSRFVNRYYETVGLQDNGDRFNAEHNEPWPQGRSNHYLFDMNRDWLALTQPETKGRVKALNKYHPLVVIDLHEMGGDESYYFAPPAEPLNPHMTKTQLQNITKVGISNAKYFDQFGFDYFTREVFDAFYPGYGDSWPTFYGAAASTYEVGSSRGMNYRKKSGEILTYKQTVQKHFIASLSTAEVVADNRKSFLNGFYNYQTQGIKTGKASKGRFIILPNARDVAGNHRLATLLAEHGVEIKQADENFKACGKNYKPGTYFIDSSQPRERFISTIMNQQVDMSVDFLKEQERRRSDKLNYEIYDVTAWSLPLMFNVETNHCAKLGALKSHQITANDVLIGKVNNPNASVAYLIPWGDMAAGRFLTAGLRAGLTIKTIDKAFTLANKKDYPAGTLVVEVKSNAKDIATKIQQLSQQTGAVIDGIDSSWAIKGPNFGSYNAVTYSAPNIAMAWDEPVSSLSAGNTRYVIERQFNYPVTAIRTKTLTDANLSFYDILILPSGEYKDFLNKEAIENLKNWVTKGGVLLTLGSATRFVADSDVALLNVKRELAFKDKKKAKDGETDEASEPSDADEKDKKSKKSTVASKLLNSKEDMIKAIENKEEKPDAVPGVLVNVDVDQNHWLTAGINKNVIAMVTGNDIYTPIKLASGKNVAWFANKDKLLASGYLWNENKKQLPYKPYLIQQPMGAGMVISFTQEPTFRAYLDGLNVLLMNAIFSSTAHSQKLK